MKLKGANISGTNHEKGRAERDFYATDPKAVDALLLNEPFQMRNVLEPCVGAGHIAEQIKLRHPETTVDCVDIIDRGYSGTIVSDFLEYDTTKKYDTIITNPPYSLAAEFIKKSFSLLSPCGKIAMFLKLQFLEGEKRRELFDKHPPSTIWVFRKRTSTWRNGEPKDENGKNWATTICHAWFVWENSKIGNDPVIKWL